MKWLYVFLAFLVCVPLTFAQQHKSDREDAGLKGKVKSIFTEIESLTDSNVNKRLPSEKEQYNEQGDRTEHLSYDYRGNPSQKMTYLSVEGARAVKTEMIQHDYDPPMVSSTEKDSSRDPRYDIKYQDKYDAKGNLVERQNIYNDGHKGNKIVAAFDDRGNKVKWELYTRDGRLNFGHTNTFDEKGNAIEEVRYGVASTKSSKYRYEYLSFDAQGNWTTRKTFKLNDKTGAYEPESLTYRTITYY